MNKLDELINALCPDGVPFVALGTVVKFLNGRAYKQQELLDAGKYKVLRVGNFHTNDKWYYSDLELADDKYCDKGDLLYTWAATLGPEIWEGERVIFHYHIWKLVFDENVLNKRFLYHFLKMDIDTISKSLTKSTMPHVSMASMNKRVVPIPPLPVQEEIVRILDTFTSLTAELQAELQARRKQYEYYREKLLSDTTDAPLKRLGDTCLMKSGKAIKAFMLLAESDSEHEYPCFGGNGIRGYIANASHHGEFPIIGRQGALCGNVNYATGDFYATEHAVVVKSLGEYDQRYLFYLLTSMNLNQYKSQGAQPGLAVGNIENLEAPVPSLEKQRKIVHVLDRFDFLCNDISAGLPAEIDARQKQYEYYRDKLLTFKELS